MLTITSFQFDEDDPNDQRRSQYELKAKLDEIEKVDSASTLTRTSLLTLSRKDFGSVVSADVVAARNTTPGPTSEITALIVVVCRRTSACICKLTLFTLRFPTAKPTGAGKQRVNFLLFI